MIKSLGLSFWDLPTQNDLEAVTLIFIVCLIIVMNSVMSLSDLSVSEAMGCLGKVVHNQVGFSLLLIQVVTQDLRLRQILCVLGTAGPVLGTGLRNITQLLFHCLGDPATGTFDYFSILCLMLQKGNFQSFCLFICKFLMYQKILSSMYCLSSSYCSFLLLLHKLYYISHFLCFIYHKFLL